MFTRPGSGRLWIGVVAPLRPQVLGKEPDFLDFLKIII